MKNTKNNNLTPNLLKKSFLFLLLGLLGACTGNPDTRSEPKPEMAQETSDENEDVIWHIKAIHPEGRFIDIKALDGKGNLFDVKAIQDSDQRQLMDVKALMEGQKVPVKILVSTDEYDPVKAIGADGTIFDIKALTPEGDTLDVKGIQSSGNIIHIKAINKEGGFYGVKAISPEGKLNDVKGVKMSEEDVEATINGVEVHAHIKALPQSEGAGDSPVWHVKAIHPEGWTLDVKALDEDGNIFDVKALQENGQRQLMDVKALKDGDRLPIKILVSTDAYAPVKAIGPDGTIYRIKALTPTGVELDVKGVHKSGNITDIKAIDGEGRFYGIKALSPEGLLNDVKGVKMVDGDLEATIHGVKVHAHIKALPQID